MCENLLLVEAKTGAPIEIENAPHRFVYSGYDGREIVLLENIEIGGVINYAAAHKISDMYGVKTGYMLIFGEGTV